MAVARVSFSMISTSRPFGVRARDARRRGQRRALGQRAPARAAAAAASSVGHVAGEADASGRRACRPLRRSPCTSSSVIASMPATRAQHGVAVGRAGEDVRLQALLAQLLLVVGAQVLLERVQLRVLQRAGSPPRGSRARASMRQRDRRRSASQLSRWTPPVKVVISLSTCASKLPAIGNSALLDLVDAHARCEPASAIIDGGQRGQALLALRVVGRADA